PCRPRSRCSGDRRTGTRARGYDRSARRPRAGVPSCLLLAAGEGDAPDRVAPVVPLDHEPAPATRLVPPELAVKADRVRAVERAPVRLVRRFVLPVHGYAFGVDAIAEFRLCARSAMRTVDEVHAPAR